MWENYTRVRCSTNNRHLLVWDGHAFGVLYLFTEKVFSIHLQSKLRTYPQNVANSYIVLEKKVCQMRRIVAEYESRIVELSQSRNFLHRNLDEKITNFEKIIQFREAVVHRCLSMDDSCELTRVANFSTILSWITTRRKFLERCYALYSYSTSYRYSR